MNVIDVLRSLKLGAYLAIRQIKRSSIGPTVLIVLVMTFTFLNLIVVKGILVGLVESATHISKERYYGDIIISTFSEERKIENSSSMVSTIAKMPWVRAYTARYIETGTITGNYKDRINYTDKPNQTTTMIFGIDPVLENKTTSLSRWIRNGSYLESDDHDYVLVGGNLLRKYLPNEAPGVVVLQNVDVGSKLLLTVGNNTKEVEVKGVVISKIDIVDQGVYVLDSTLRSLSG